MAVTRRNYIFAAFMSSVLCVILTVVAISGDSWIVSDAYASNQGRDSTIRYGLFRGEFTLYILNTPSENTLFMTCIPDMNACAVSCKTEASAREQEVRALASGYRTNQACTAVTIVNTTDPLEDPPVISFALYVSTLVLIFVKLILAVVAAALAILNATNNPTEPVFGVPGCLWMNVATTILGLTVMLMFGVYWATSGLKLHLAFSYIVSGGLHPSPGLGYSYWLLIGAVICSTTNIVLLQVRRFLLERNPPPPTIKLENHSDGTIFLY